MFCKSAGYLSEWPVNLIEEILERPVEEPPTDWQIEGLDFIVSRLNSRMSEMILHKFRDGMTLAEISDIFGVGRERVRQIIARGIRLMRHPTKKIYILKDYKAVIRDYEKKLAKLTEEISEREAELEQLKEQLQETWDDVQKAKYVAIDIKILPTLKLPIADMDLSVRSYNCLVRSGMDTVEDVLNWWNENELRGIRNCGEKSREEIRKKLVQLGVM